MGPCVCCVSVTEGNQVLLHGSMAILFRAVVYCTVLWLMGCLSGQCNVVATYVHSTRQEGHGAKLLN